MMTPERYAQVISAIGFNQNSMAHFLRIDPRMSRDWASGHKEIPYYIEMLLEVMIAHNITARQIALLMERIHPEDDGDLSET